MSIAVTIAGSDSGGGAGIQADLKTFEAFGVYGASVLTAVTAQNTTAVTAIHQIPISVIDAQLDAVFSDFEVGAAKPGMLANAEVLGAVTTRLRTCKALRLVVDPVMVAKSGDNLLSTDAITALKRELLPLALVLTPNVPEAEALAGVTIRSDRDAELAAHQLHEAGAVWVVVKGGHRPGSARDLVSHNGATYYLERERIETRSTHGTGCTFSAAIAALLALGGDVESAIAEAKDFVTDAIANAEGLGHGHGPLNHHFGQLVQHSSRRVS